MKICHCINEHESVRRNVHECSELSASELHVLRTPRRLTAGSSLIQCDGAAKDTATRDFPTIGRNPRHGRIIYDLWPFLRMR